MIATLNWMESIEINRDGCIFVPEIPWTKIMCMTWTRVSLSKFGMMHDKNWSSILWDFQGFSSFLCFFFLFSSLVGNHPGFPKNFMGFFNDSSFSVGLYFLLHSFRSFWRMVQIFSDGEIMMRIWWNAKWESLNISYDREKWDELFAEIFPPPAPNPHEKKNKEKWK